MKKALIITGSVLGVLMLVIVIFAAMSGAFTNPAPVTEKVMGPYTLCYVEHKGDYSQAGKIGTEIYNKLIAEFGIKTTKGFGIY